MNIRWGKNNEKLWTAASGFSLIQNSDPQFLENHQSIVKNTAKCYVFFKNALLRDYLIINIFFVCVKLCFSSVLFVIIE
jgi:hypothetical protein